MVSAAAKDAWEAHEGRAHGQNDPATGKPYEKPAAPTTTPAPAPPPEHPKKHRA